MDAEIESAVQKLMKADANNLYARLGASTKTFPANPTQFAAPAAAATLDVALAGPLEDLIGLGERILKRWNKAIYDLVCGSGDDIDPAARKTILNAIQLGKPDALATAITGVLIGVFSVGPGVALVVGVLFGKVLMPVAGQEVCAFWKARL